MPAVTTLQIRHSTAANWTSVNPILAIGEMGVETDTDKFKFGDGSTVWASLPYGATTTGPAQSKPFRSLGDGSDGNVVISSGTTTLTRDMYYNNLTLNGTGVLNTANYRIYVLGVLDISAAQTGAIIIDGADGASGIGNQHGANATAPVAGSVGAGSVGSNGVNGTPSVGGNGTNGTVASVSNGGASGAGGTGGSGSAGAAGTAGTGATPAASFPIRRFEQALLSGTALIGGGAGGGSGSPGNGNGSGSGGGSGTGGTGAGVLAIYANIINRGTNTNGSIIRARGGVGGGGGFPSGGNEGGGAGSGGGGGGWIFIAYNALAGSTITNALSVAGGAGGLGGNGSGGLNHWLTRKSANNGTTWSNSDDFNLTPTRSSGAQAVGRDSLGNIYAAGFGFDATSSQTWVVRKSADNGTTWTTVDTFLYSSPNLSIAFGIFGDNSGNVFAIGNGSDGANTHWIVRRSADQGATWTTVDNYMLAAGKDAHPYTINMDSLGNLYACGYALGTPAGAHWIVRKSTDAGLSWNTVDDFQYLSPNDSVPTTLTGDSLGNMFVSGSGRVTDQTFHWLTRKSTDQGATWSTVDDFNYVAGKGSVSQGIIIDSLNNLYATGFGADSTNINHWLTRKSTNQGTSWSTVDDFNYVAITNNTQANMVGVDNSGNIYSTGQGTVTTGSNHWLTRKSTDQGATWSTVDDYQLAVNQNAVPLGFNKDVAGNLYAAGSAIDGTGSATGGGGGSGGSGGTITLYQITTGIGSSSSGSAGSAGSAASGFTGGSGGAGNIFRVNL